MGVVVLGIKAVIAVVSSLGVASGMNWFGKKVFTGSKKGGSRHESDFDTEKFNRRDI
jgi:hypothetical protein